MVFPEERIQHGTQDSQKVIGTSLKQLSSGSWSLTAKPSVRKILTLQNQIHLESESSCKTLSSDIQPFWHPETTGPPFLQSSQTSSCCWCQDRLQLEIPQMTNRSPGAN
ncbi:uncharacterized protein LOC107985043 isoform X2 [Homo sapiens]|uniref:uncharacterized protein LOC107985043 isoform X2 n=1 Tax=Homo sapiens TaxID=9606 RepID=UPI001FB0F817|nr:uncharacterized protein LOC107985043 isoform X2 [Homo sapiens]XP_047299625.1 uncharacterized protein LOC107985043 isoform X2 [Homo sapiens]